LEDVNHKNKVNNLKLSPEEADYLPCVSLNNSKIAGRYAALTRLGADVTYVEWLHEELELADICFELLKSAIVIPGVRVGGLTLFGN
jgi:hypothetical protein